MDFLKDFMTSYSDIVIIGLIAIVLIQFIMFITLLVKNSKLQNRYRKVMRGVNNKNLETLIIDYLDKVESSKASMDGVVERFNELDNRIERCIQKTAIMRYQAFDDVGADLSYSIALLDDHNDGVIITGIYGRNESTSYAKPIDNGISRYDLSEEEEDVLMKAINNYKIKESSSKTK